MKDITPSLVHWSYIFLALTLRYEIYSKMQVDFSTGGDEWRLTLGTIIQLRLLEAMTNFLAYMAYIWWVTVNSLI